MKRRIILPLLAGMAVVLGGCGEDLLSASPSEAAAQQVPEGSAQQQRPGPGMRGMRGEPLARILEQREALGLTADQVTRLEALAARIRTGHETLREQMQAQMPERARGERAQMTEEERTARREQMRARREALRPLMEEVRESLRAAQEEVRGILTDEQEAKLRELRPERPEGMRGPRGEGRRGFPGGRGPRA